MLSKIAGILHSNDIHLIMWVLIFQVLDNVQLYLRLMSEFFFISDNFDGHDLSSLMINTFDCLSE